MARFYGILFLQNYAIDFPYKIFIKIIVFQEFVAKLYFQALTLPLYLIYRGLLRQNGRMALVMRDLAPCTSFLKVLTTDVWEVL
jgi:hypothetical protein